MSEREWHFYIDDMIRFAENAQTYTEALSFSEFISSGLNYDATLRNIELIGEAAKHIPSKIKESHQQIPWRMIIATRNHLIHGYLGLDNDTLWSVIQDDLPPLIKNLKTIQL